MLSLGLLDASFLQGFALNDAVVESKCLDIVILLIGLPGTGRRP